MNTGEWNTSVWIAIALVILLFILLITISVSSTETLNFTEDYSIDSLPPYDPRLVSLVENTEDAKYSILILSNCNLSDKSDSLRFARTCSLIESKNRAYAEKYGYDIELVHVPQKEKQYSLILQELEKRPTLDYILWVNDSVINRKECNLVELVKVAGSANIIITRSSDPNKILDDNVILIKNTEQSRKMLDAVSKGTALTFFLDSDFNSSGFIKGSRDMLFKSFKACLDNGYPIRTRNFLIFDNNVFSGNRPSNFIVNIANTLDKKILSEQSASTLVYPWNQSRIKTVPRYIPARVASSNTNNSIPKAIYQTFTTVAVPTEIHNAVMSWVMENKEYEYYFYDDADCEQYIEQFFPSALQSFKDIVPGAYKADLFRYCIIYNNGGVYADVKSICRTPIREMVDTLDKKEVQMIITLDRDRRELYNAFFASVPKNVVLKNTIESCIQMIQDRKYGKSPLDITGPTRFGVIFYEYMNKQGMQDILTPGTIYLDGIGRIEVFEHSIRDPKSIIDKDGRVITTTRCTIKSIAERNESDYLFNITGKGHYGYYWNKRLVYN